MQGGVLNAGDAFGLIGAALYNRFEQEDEMDRRVLKAFEDNIDKAPKQTHPLICLLTLSPHPPISPTIRAQKPDFYGYVPDGSHARTICFGSLIAISSFMLTIKTLGLVLLSAGSLDYVAVFFATDIGSYLLIKIIRGDFIYWVPLGGFISILASLLMRVGVKVITDFTCVVQLRHPNEVGGAQWVFGQLISVATLFIALHLAEASEKLGKDMSRLWFISYILTGSALFSFCVFFSNINKGYTHTFFSLETGGQMNIRTFREQEEDGAKAAAIFTNNKNQWKSIYDEVKEWVWQNWPK